MVIPRYHREIVKLEETRAGLQFEMGHAEIMLSRWQEHQFEDALRESRESKY